jgi:anaerobic magnesium-protoporphyrin IX monomethyl ester cyclase
MQTPRIAVVSVEDGIENLGFRHISAFIRTKCENTQIYYISTGNWRSLKRYLFATMAARLRESDVRLAARQVADNDILAISAMTPYSDDTKQLIAEARKLNPGIYVIWGGIHAIMEPEDAIKHADAVCTGEGEFAFEQFYDAYVSGQDYTHTPGFWFNTQSGIVKNRNLPLMTQAQMDSLPPPTYFDGEQFFVSGEGFRPLTVDDSLNSMGLAYTTIWTIGCPFKCTFCGNTKFIEYDHGYRKPRHSSVRVIIDEVKRAIAKCPHIKNIVFSDDSFLALKLDVLREFAAVYKREIGLPFTVPGVIPNYVRHDKMAVLVDAGLVRVRMGIQSGSERILQFYDRPTPLPKIRNALEILKDFTPAMIPPAFDIILDNPVEEPADTLATLDMIYDMPRPYTLNTLSLRIIPNTEMARRFDEMKMSIPDIRSCYFSNRPTLGNVLVHLLPVWKIPEPLYRKLRARVLPSHVEQPLYPVLYLLVRLLFLSTRGFNHLRFMDFSALTGRFGYWMWKLGIIDFWGRFYVDRRRNRNQEKLRLAGQFAQ